MSSSPSDAIIGRMVHHLMVVQRLNMLDTTKCSTTARRVFNYMCGLGAVETNDNLSHTPPNLAELVEGLTRSSERTDVTDIGTDMRMDIGIGMRVAYVHFDHLTNETSHYFIVVAHGGRVTLLQSAVFEFGFPQRSGRTPIGRRRCCGSARRVLG